MDNELFMFMVMTIYEQYHESEKDNPLSCLYSPTGNLNSDHYLVNILLAPIGENKKQRARSELRKRIKEYIRLNTPVP